MLSAFWEAFVASDLISDLICFFYMLCLKPRNAVSVSACTAVSRWCWRMAPWGVASGRRRSKGALLLLPNQPPYCQIHKAISRYSVSLRLLGAATPASKKTTIDQHHPTPATALTHLGLLKTLDLDFRFVFGDVVAVAVMSSRWRLQPQLLRGGG